MNFERRRFVRYKPPDRGLFATNAESSMTVKINDISRGGLQFKYLPVPGLNSDWGKIDVFLANPDRTYLSSIPCEIVYDISDLEESGTFSGTQSRICGLKFIKLRSEQASRLQNILFCVCTK